jgi:hypothetical protein
MTPNTPLADALMLKIRDQYSHETEERHRKRFMEMVRNGDPALREEIAKSLFAIYSSRADAAVTGESRRREAHAHVATGRIDFGTGPR